VVDNDNSETPVEASGGASAPADDVDAVRAENAALKDQALRYAAEAENTRRRAEKEVNDARAYAIQRFARDLFEAADNLSRAMQAARGANLAQHAEPAIKNLVLGIDMTEKALQTAFERNGLKIIDPAKGEKFDPHRHQAMMEQPAEGVGPGAVVAVMQTGYELFGRVVRPAMVAVTPKAATGATAGAASGEPHNPYANGADTGGAAVDTKA
jgi:molecular chaperone GrpE